MSCGKTQEFLAKAGVTSKTQVDAKKNVQGAAEAKAILKEVQEIYIAKGAKVVHFDLKKDKPEDVVPLMLGPTGNLRAPALRKGKTLVVGFNKETYQKLFG
jgi:arsenate reductase-like glutaredoxin family protein